MSPASLSRLPLVVAITFLFGSGLPACRQNTENSDGIDTETPAASGGKKASGGSSGAKGGSTGAGKASGGAAGVATGTGGAGGAPAPSDDAAPTPTPTPKTDATAPATDTAEADVPAATDTAAPAIDAIVAPGAGSLGPDGLAICHSDATVIAICKQLENACENCPPGGAPPKNKLAAVCFDLVKKARAGMAKDADCAKFAVDNKCTVDKGGNVCGSLNCTVAGCDKAACDKWQQWGDAAMCRPLMAKCGPCK
jgi:hypothetical protein